MVKQRTFILALAAALLMLLLIGSVASADGNVPGATSPQTAKSEVCVDGYVINHREQPVDGTKVIPPLVVEAVGAANSTTGAAEAVVGTADVGTDGYFKFSNLAAGAYNFRMQLPAAWEGIVPQARLGGVAETGFTQFKKSSTCYRIVFKIRRLVTIPVLKWEEQLDGTVVPGDDWLITATPVNDGFAKVVTATVQSGTALLTLTPGTWNVAETVKSGWVPLTPSTVTRVIDQYQASGAVAPIVFKNRVPVCYSKLTVIKKGVGTNANGEDEQLGTLAGWKFTLSAADGSTTSVTKTTGGDGQVVFENITPGVYKVTETLQPGWETDETSKTVVIHNCDSPDPITFVNHEMIGQRKIYGTKWFKAWEPPYKGTLIGLPGWTITATLVGTESFDQPVELVTTTDALGKYEFTQAQLENAGMGFAGASIKVCEEQRDHWIPKTPVCVTIKFPYPVPPDYTGAKVDFTNVQDPPVASAPAAGVMRAPASSGCSGFYTVKSGDTLAKIAGRFHVSAKGILRLNNIRNADVIYLGQNICLP